MLKIGLTGGIGSGKTTVANLFEDLEITIIDSDVIARELIVSEHVFSEVLKKFGASILNNKGELDRKKLRTLIFNDSDTKKWLEDLLHPLIKKEIQRQILKASSLYCIIVIPLLVETQSYDLIDRVLLVDAKEEEQLKRTSLRDQLDEKHIIKMLQGQATRKERLAIADDIIHNSGSLDDLKKQVTQLHQFYLTIS